MLPLIFIFCRQINTWLHVVGALSMLNVGSKVCGIFVPNQFICCRLGTDTAGWAQLLGNLNNIDVSKNGKTHILYIKPHMIYVNGETLIELLCSVICHHNICGSFDSPKLLGVKLPRELNYMYIFSILDIVKHFVHCITNADSNPHFIQNLSLSRTVKSNFPQSVSSFNDLSRSILLFKV